MPNEQKERFSKSVALELESQIPEATIKHNPSAVFFDEDQIEVSSDHIEGIATRLKKHYPFLMDICGLLIQWKKNI